MEPDESFGTGDKVLPPYLTGEEDFVNLKDIYDNVSTARVIRRDPIVLDLDGDGLIYIGSALVRLKSNLKTDTDINISMTRTVILPLPVYIPPPYKDHLILLLVTLTS